MNFPINASKQQKSIVYQYVAHFVEKNSFCQYLSPFTGLIKNSCLNKSNFSSGFSPFKYGKKKNFLSVSMLISEIVNFD